MNRAFLTRSHSSERPICGESNYQAQRPVNALFFVSFKYCISDKPVFLCNSKDNFACITWYHIPRENIYHSFCSLLERTYIAIRSPKLAKYRVRLTKFVESRRAPLLTILIDKCHSLCALMSLF